MEMYQVGAESLDQYEIERIPQSYIFVVYDYEYESYSGSGLAAALCADGTVFYWDMGHCSCYGPCDETDYAQTGAPLEEFLTFDVKDDCVKGRNRSPRDYNYSRWQSVVSKFREVIDARKATA